MIEMDEFLFHDKPIEEMTEEELMAERDCQAWMANRMADIINKQKFRLSGYQDSMPYVDEDDIQKMYEDGQITREERNKIRKVARRRKYDHDRAEMYTAYAEMLEAHFKAVKVKCSEQIMILRGSEKVAVRGRKPRPRKPPRYRDPRKNKVRRNQYAPVAPIIGYRTKWNKLSRIRFNETLKLARRIPLRYWNYESLKRVAVSKGYGSVTTLSAAVAQEFGLTVRSATDFLRDGRLGWGHVLVLASFLEMTPAEFCDVCLHGFFKEVVDGKFVAHITEEEKKAFLKGSPKTAKEDDDGIDHADEYDE